MTEAKNMHHSQIIFFICTIGFLLLTPSKCNPKLEELVASSASSASYGVSLPTTGNLALPSTSPSRLQPGTVASLGRSANIESNGVQENVFGLEFVRRGAALGNNDGFVSRLFGPPTELVDHILHFGPPKDCANSSPAKCAGSGGVLNTLTQPIRRIGKAVRNVVPIPGILGGKPSNYCGEDGIGGDMLRAGYNDCGPRAASQTVSAPNVSSYAAAATFQTLPQSEPVIISAFSDATISEPGRPQPSGVAQSYVSIGHNGMYNTVVAPNPPQLNGQRSNQNGFYATPNYYTGNTNLQKELMQPPLNLGMDDTPVQETGNGFPFFTSKADASATVATSQLLDSADQLIKVSGSKQVNNLKRTNESIENNFKVQSVNIPTNLQHGYIYF